MSVSPCSTAGGRPRLFCSHPYLAGAPAAVIWRFGHGRSGRFTPLAKTERALRSVIEERDNFEPDGNAATCAAKTI
jgi:hypothetical protein